MNDPEDQVRSSSPTQAAEPEAQAPQNWRARAWRALGATSVAIGVINAFIPLLPTTVFLLIGVWAYGKGDPRLRVHLLAHPRFGPTLRAWVEHRQISTHGKVGASIGIAISMVITTWMVGWRPLTWMIDAGLVCLILYLVTRPGQGPG